jgi:hypothetical protein
VSTDQQNSDAPEDVPPMRWKLRLLGKERRRNHYIGMAGSLLIALSPFLPMFRVPDGWLTLFHVNSGVATIIEILGAVACLLAQFRQTSVLPVLGATAGLLGGWYLLEDWVVVADGITTRDLAKFHHTVGVALEPTWFWLVLGVGVVLAFVADFTDPYRGKRGQRRRLAEQFAAAPPPTPPAIPPRPRSGAVPPPFTTPPRPRR